MGLFDRFKKAENVTVTEDTNSGANKQRSSDTTPESKEYGVLPRETSQAHDEEELSKDAQAGVLKMEASTTVWSKTHLILAYIMYVLYCRIGR